MNAKIKKHLIKNDQVLKSIINTLDFPQIIRTGNVFHDLVSCIVEQQIHYRSTKKTFQKSLDRACLSELSVDNFEVYEKEGLQGMSLSMKKLETLLGIHEFFKIEKVDWAELSDNEVKDKLSKIKGVGKWTIDMILLYSLGRLNVFPLDDYHLKLIMTTVYGLNPKAKLGAQMRSIASTWNPNASFGVLYLLAWKEYLKNHPL